MNLGRSNGVIFDNGSYLAFTIPRFATVNYRYLLVPLILIDLRTFICIFLSTVYSISLLIANGKHSQNE